MTSVLTEFPNLPRKYPPNRAEPVGTYWYFRIPGHLLASVAPNESLPHASVSTTNPRRSPPPATILSRFTAVDTAVSSFLHRHNPLPYSLFLLLDIAVIGLVKVVFHRSRPSYNHSSSMSVAVHADNFSFPSGHASRVFLVATAIQFSASEIGGSLPKVAGAGAGPKCGGWERVLLGVWTWAFATAASRVLLGRHYLCDVIVGSCLGVIEGFVYCWFFRFNGFIWL